MNGLDIKLRTDEPSPAHVQISRELERLIRTEKLVHGQRLPATGVLVKRWGTNVTAVQKAMEHLCSVGLIERRPRRGTFVRKEADKAVIGVLIGPHLLHETAHFHRALVEAVQKEIGQREMRSRLYDQLTFGNETAIRETQARLMYDIEHHCFKGLVLIGFGNVPRKEEVVASNLPKVLLGGGTNAPSVLPDWYDLTHSAVSHLAAQERTRIAYLCTLRDHESVVPGDLQGLRDGMKAAGLTFAPGRIHAPRDWTPSRDFSYERFGYSWMRTLLEEWSREGNPPDGLIVADDVLMRGVAHALADHRIRVPEEMAIVTAANEGIDHFYAVPVVRYKFPIPELAHQSCRLLWLQLSGGAPPETPVLVKGRLMPAER